MTTNIGISAFAWTAHFEAHHLTLLPKLREQGFAALELPMFDPAALPAAAIRKAFRENELVCTVCAILPAGINPISPDAAVRRRSLRHLIACVEQTAAMGAHLLGGPVFAPIGYLPPHRPTADEWAWAIEAFQALTEYLDRYAIALSLEPVNRSETFFLRTAAEAKRLCEAISHPLVGVTIDTFHANIEEKSVPAAITLLGPHLKHMHLSENDRGLLGQGQVDFPAIFEALRGIDYKGCLTIEGFGYSPNDSRSPGYLWADPEVSPERLAFEGIRYLQSLCEE